MILALREIVFLMIVPLCKVMLKKSYSFRDYRYFVYNLRIKINLWNCRFTLFKHILYPAFISITFVILNNLPAFNTWPRKIVYRLKQDPDGTRSAYNHRGFKTLSKVEVIQSRGGSYCLLHQVLPFHSYIYARTRFQWKLLQKGDCILVKLIKVVISAILSIICRYYW